MGEQQAENFETQYNNYFENNGDVAIEDDSSDTDDVGESENQNDEVEQDGVPQVSEDEAETEKTGGDEDEEPEPIAADKQEEIDNNLKVALKQERTKRQEQDKILQQLQNEHKQTREALAALLNPEQKEAAPEYDDDPLGYMKWQQDQLNTKFEQQQQLINQQNQQAQAYQQAVALNNEYMTEKEQYSKKNPEIDNAANFLQDSVLNEYKALGYDDEQATQLLLQDKLSLLTTAKSQGVNSAEMIMNLAKARGFQPTNSSNQKLNTVKQGQKKSKSLSGSAGANINNNTTLDDVSKMNDKEFTKFWDDFKRGNLQL